MPDKVKFIGEITHKEVLQRSYNADALFMIRDSLLPINKYICGSKILEAMMCGTPIIVSEDTSTAKKVTKEKCGLVINPKKIDKNFAQLSFNSRLLFKEMERRGYDDEIDIWELIWLKR